MNSEGKSKEKSIEHCFLSAHRATKATLASNLPPLYHFFSELLLFHAVQRHSFDFVKNALLVRDYLLRLLGRGCKKGVVIEVL